MKAQGYTQFRLKPMKSVYLAALHDSTYNWKQFCFLFILCCIADMEVLLIQIVFAVSPIFMVIGFLDF